MFISDVSDSAMDNSVQTKAHNSDEKIELISSFKEKEIIENQIKTSSNFDQNAQPDKINLLSTSGKFETDNEETLCNNSSPASHDDVNQSHITKSTDCMHNKNDTISINNTDSDETLANDVFLHNSDKSESRFKQMQSIKKMINKLRMINKFLLSHINNFLLNI